MWQVFAVGGKNGFRAAIRRMYLKRAFHLEGCSKYSHDSAFVASVLFTEIFVS
jgi:hypothetical protein